MNNKIGLVLSITVAGLGVVAGCSSNRETGSSDDLVALIESIKPWTVSGQYIREDWEHVIRAAQVFQRLPPERAKVALTGFLEKAEGHTMHPEFEEESKPFILLRTMFLVPESAKRTESFAFKGWVDYGNYTNVDGTVNLCWPISWAGGTPRLVARYSGSDGHRYDAVGEYEHMRKRFQWRQLDKVILP